MEDYFEQEFEDELDALRDLEAEECIYDSKPRRSLFDKSSPKSSELNDSLPVAIDYTPTESECKTPKRQRISPYPEKTPVASKKRRRNQSSSSDDLPTPKLLHDEFFSSNLLSCKSKKENQSTSYVDVTPKVKASCGLKLQRRIPAGDFIPITSTDGIRTGYAPLKHDHLDLQKNNDVRSGSSNFLLADFQVLKKEVEEKRSQKSLDLVQLTEENNASSIDDDSDVENSSKENRLWVDFYSPKLYIDLLSDECVNRVFLKWIKMWDYVVFGKQKPAHLNKKQTSKATKFLSKQEAKKQFNKQKYEELGLDENFDSLYRPMQKVVLLCGRPGLGKTTLAHVVARHAGYNVIEMNASDERTASSFKERIEDSLTMKPLLGIKSDARPNCLIIDEIDGAPAAAINALLSKITESSQDSKKEKSQLLRPIICICNDQYVPSLRTLKQHALLLNFTSQNPSVIGSRLHEICKGEGLKADMATLISLSLRTGCDIRSCLNTLQFIKQNRRELTPTFLKSISIGSKDEQKSLFAFWQQVFQVPRQNSASYIPGINGDAISDQAELDVRPESLSSRIEWIYREANACGEFNRLLQGLHENFLNMKYKDPFMKSINGGYEWLCFTDVVNRQILSQQNFLLSPYLYYLPVVFHLHFAQNNMPKITYPKTQFEVTSKQNHSQHLITSMCEQISPHVYQHVNGVVLSMDLLPLLVDTILQPNMRPVNIQLYSSSEKTQLSEVVSTMIAYNLTYLQKKGEEGQYTYSLEPPVDEINRYTDIKQTRKPLSYTAKQLIANEIQQEKQRRLDKKNSNSKQIVQPDAPIHSPSAKYNKELNTPASKKKDVTTPNHKQKLVPKNVTPSQRGARDFFGRPIENQQKKLSPDAIKSEKDSKLLVNDVWYRHKEGFSSAVRKSISIHQLL